MLDEIMGAYGSRFFLAAGGVGVALLVLIGILWLMRTRAPSPFVRGGKNRQPRLQVLDAAAVDTRRRLVLVRRDDVEHLIMIGGPTDIVIESRILPETDDDAGTVIVPAPIPAPAAVAAPAAIAAPAPVIEPRPEPVVERPQLRAVPDPKPEPRPEPRVEPRPEPVAIFEEEEAEPEPYIPAPAPVIEPRPQPVAPVSITPVAVAQARPIAPEAPATPPAPPLAVNPEPRVQPQFVARPPERPAVAPQVETVNAADILDAARARVLQPNRFDPVVSPPPAQSIPAAAVVAPAAFADAGTPPQEPRGEFQRILEEEMNANLTAERVVPVQGQPIRPVPPQPGSLPRRDPEMAPITGSDAELQKEVARIFGEMSVNRDK